MSELPLTLVLGASPNESRYSHMATLKLRRHGHPVVAFGKRGGDIGDTTILVGEGNLPADGIDTVTMYLGAPAQREYYDYLLRLKPRRVIFNPGAENPELAGLLQQQGIATEEACTLVLLGLGAY
jgi:predicted CoA-binding protein